MCASQAAAMLAVLIPKEGYDKLQHDFALRVQAGTGAYSLSIWTSR